MQNLIYALIQVIHNLGAVTVAGAAASAIWLVDGNAVVWRRLSYLTAVAWAVQVASGVMFGAATYYFEKHLPDIHGVAVDALLVKIGCAVAGLVLAVAYLRLNSGWTLNRQLLVWHALLTLGVIALGSAAFLRWFS